ncbi:uncharacterized protein LOC124289873 [Haliotis rubra]|uniref:uncharacterized protein LOC124289873 n=1 Tax=Haliotis rubra TaxID=36100 RepID=UPI001EE56CC3|nr:uncharacterized protein LOC124289873 [Haliotis rubra]
MTFISHQMYCYMVLLLLWFNFARAVVGLFPLNEGLPLRIIFTSWYLQCTLNATIMLVSCQRLSHLRSFYKHWDSLFKNNATKEIGCGIKCPIEYFKLVTSAGWCVVAVSLTACFIVTLGNSPTLKPVTGDFTRPFQEEPWEVSLILILYTFSTGAWVFPVIFVVVVSSVIKGQFLRFRDVLSKQIQEAGDNIPASLPALRSRYSQLCQTVAIINRTFKWILGVSFFLQVLLACFISYQMINGPKEIVTTFIHSYWLGGSFVFIILLTRSSSDVNDAAHSLLEDIFQIGTINATTEYLGQLNLFVSQLTGTSTGFTAMNFFVIRKEFLLTLGGLFITYFFVLMQFKI